ncbi:MAG: integrase [Rhodovulum sulfidophilum]|uniref:Integrase n=1 Tax=Rhodovulum sulfidophilum TaxID=35806 RepID=A0A2W5Q7R0_RHOSU|nr:MAG: integrase [Rhodovulum sulfidophilum]
MSSSPLGAPPEAAGGEAMAANTRRAYANDWARFTRWCRARGAEALPPDPRLIGLYLADGAAPGGARLSVTSLERALSGLVWNYRARGLVLDRADPRLAAVLAGIRGGQATPPRRKEPLAAEEILAMAATLPRDLRGLRDRAILLLGFAGGLRRSELVGLDRARGPDSQGWVEILPEGALLTLRGKPGWREVAIGRGASERSCPVLALESWLRFGRIEAGAVFRRVSRDGARALPGRLSDRHVARLVKATVRAAGLRPELSEAERDALYAGHSLRMGLASQAGAAEVEADRFRVNRTRAAGL